MHLLAKLFSEAIAPFYNPSESDRVPVPPLPPGTDARWVTSGSVFLMLWSRSCVVLIFISLMMHVLSICSCHSGLYVSSSHKYCPRFLPLPSNGLLFFDLWFSHIFQLLVLCLIHVFW